MCLTVLIVDDSKLARTMIRKALPDQRSWEVYEASNGQEALEKCRETAFDLIFLDLTMPVMDGYDFLEASFQEGLARAKIFVASADVQPKAEDRVRGYGVTDFIKKGSKFEEFQAELTNSLKKNHIL